LLSFGNYIWQRGERIRKEKEKGKGKGKGKSHKLMMSGWGR
jgi:hypothetical protein